MLLFFPSSYAAEPGGIHHHSPALRFSSSILLIDQSYPLIKTSHNISHPIGGAYEMLSEIRAGDKLNLETDKDNDNFTDDELAGGTDPLSRFSCRSGCLSSQTQN